MHNEINKIIVIGPPRSGTTLLSGLVSNSDESYPNLPECTFVTQLIQHYYNILNYSDKPRFSAYAIDESTLLGIYKSAAYKFIENALGHFSEIKRRNIVLKDPELTIYADLIPFFFGKNFKCIFIARDPRYVISSMAKVVKIKKKYAMDSLNSSLSLSNLFKFLQVCYEESQIISLVFNYYYTFHNSNIFKSNASHVVRYEKIVNRDIDEFDRLDQFLGFKVSRVGFGNSLFGFDTADPTHSCNYGKEIKNNTSDFEITLSRKRILKVKNVFSGINEIYKWW